MRYECRAWRPTDPATYLPNGIVLLLNRRRTGSQVSFFLRLIRASISSTSLARIGWQCAVHSVGGGVWARPGVAGGNRQFSRDNENVHPHAYSSTRPVSDRRSRFQHLSKHITRRTAVSCARTECSTSTAGEGLVGASNPVLRPSYWGSFTPKTQQSLIILTTTNSY